MICIRYPGKKALLSGLVPVVVWLAFLATQTTAFAYDRIVGLAEALPNSTAAPLQQPRGESELPWLFAVYIITWAAFFGYTFVMSQRQREMRREIDILRRVITEREIQVTSGDSE